MADLAKLTVKLEAESSKLRTELERVNGKLDKFERKTSATMAKVKTVVSSAAKAFVAFAAVDTVKSGFTSVVKAAETAERQMMKLEGIVKATGGAAGYTAKAFDTMARDLARATLANTEGVRDAIGVLATFRSVHGETFERALGLSQDLATVMGTDLKSSVLQLGKALEDPSIGLSALTRSGVSFSAAEKDLIKSLQDSGRAFEAQSKILDKVAEQVGGAGRAEAGGLTGSVDSLAQSWDEVLEAVGNTGPWKSAVDWMTKVNQGVLTWIKTTDQMKFDKLINQREELKAKIADPGERSLYERLMGENYFTNELAAVNKQIDAMVEARERMERAQSAMQKAVAAPASVAAGSVTEPKRMTIKISDPLKDLREEAVAIEEAMRAPVEVFQTSLLKLNEIRDEGLIGWETYYKALGTYQDDFDRAMQDTPGMRAHNQMLEEGKRLTESLRTPQEEFNQEMDNLNRLLEAGAIDWETYFRAEDELAKKLNGDGGKLKLVAEQLGMTFSSAFEDAIVEGEKLSDVLRGLAQDTLRIFTRKAITEPLAGAITGVFAKGLGIPGFAAGGNPPVGVPSIVGEKGPELFIPKTAGTIIPNGGLGGVSVNQSYVINAQGAGPGVTAEIRRALEESKRQTIASIVDLQSRGGLPGFQ